MAPPAGVAVQFVSDGAMAGSSPGAAAPIRSEVIVLFAGLPVLAATAGGAAARRAAPAGPGRVAGARRSRSLAQAVGDGLARAARRRIALSRRPPTSSCCAFFPARSSPRCCSPARGCARIGPALWLDAAIGVARRRGGRHAAARARPCATRTGGGWDSALALAYPMGDVLLVVMVRRRADAARLAREPGLAAARRGGLLAHVVADVGYVVCRPRGRAAPRCGCRCSASLSPLLIAAAAWSPVSRAAPGRARRLAHARHADAARARRRRAAGRRPLPRDRRRRDLARRRDARRRARPDGADLRREHRAARTRASSRSPTS